MKSRTCSYFAKLALTIAVCGPLPVTASAIAEPDYKPAFTGEATIGAVEYSHPQLRIAVDGARRLNLVCLGLGDPTVILEAGSDGSTLDWRSVQGRIAQVTRTCSYDRAGYGFSDPSSSRSDARDAVDDLHRLVAAANLSHPLILVGHSNGGLYAALYGETYPGDVGGMVLIDPGFPGQQNYDAYALSLTKAAELKAWTAGLVLNAAGCVRLAKTGALTRDFSKASKCLDYPPNPDTLIHQTLNKQYASEAYQEANLSEFESSFAADHGITLDDREMSSLPHPLGAMPLIVLTATRHPAPISDFTPQDQAAFYAAWKHGHDLLAALSTRGRDFVVGNTGHFIQTDQPDAVVRAVKEIINIERREQSNTTHRDKR